MKNFLTPQEAEAAFYQAFENADIELMLSVWSEDDDITCIHPMSQCLRGKAVLNSWQNIFQQSPNMKFQLSDVCIYTGQDISIHTLCENLTVIHNPHSTSSLLATNVYRWQQGSWRMIVHHTSIMVIESPVEAEIETKKILH